MPQEMSVEDRITNIIIDMDAYDGTKGHAPALQATTDIMRLVGKGAKWYKDQAGDMADIIQNTTFPRKGGWNMLTGDDCKILAQALTEAGYGRVRIPEDIGKRISLIGRSLILAWNAWSRDTAEHAQARDKIVDGFVNAIIAEFYRLNPGLKEGM